MSPYSLLVWERWVRSKQGPPDGDRIDPDDEDEDIDELEESDALRFDCQLAAIGLLSRICIPQSMPQLRGLTMSKLNAITASLQKSEAVPVALWEDLHWLFLSIGHMIADETDAGETRFIPAQIMAFSVQQAAAVSQVAAESTDHLVALVDVILKAMEIEMAAMSAQICHAWSPQTAEDLRWLLLRFAEAYVWFDEDHSPIVSSAIHAALGRKGLKF